MDREQVLYGVEAPEAAVALCEPLAPAVETIPAAQLDSDTPVTQPPDNPEPIDPLDVTAPAAESADVALAAESDDNSALAESADTIPACAEATLTISLPPSPAGEPTPEHIVEALLFASDAPLSAGRLAELSGLGSAREIERHIDALNEKYAAAGLSFRIEPIARGYQMLTLPAFQPWLVKLDKHRGQTRLSAAALEALSIVAYKQPVIRADVEAIRGVACGEVLNRLREMGLVKIVGRAEIVGRPILYGTTKKFLDTFGLADLNDLPQMESLTFRRPATTAPVAAPLAPAPEMPPLPAELELPPTIAAAGV
jgi:segregation and condensation protein B